MSKGKGIGLSFHPHCRSICAPGRPVLTRLTGMMGFEELNACDLDAPSGAAPGEPDKPTIQALSRQGDLR